RRLLENYGGLRPRLIASSNGSTDQGRRSDQAGTLVSLPSRPGEFHPEPLTDPYVSLSTYTARAIARRRPPSAERRAPPTQPIGPNQPRPPSPHDPFPPLPPPPHP